MNLWFPCCSGGLGKPSAKSLSIRGCYVIKRWAPWPIAWRKMITWLIPGAVTDLGNYFRGFFLYTVRPYVGLGQWFPTGGVGRGTQIVFKNKIQTEFHHLGSRYIACPPAFSLFLGRGGLYPACYLAVSADLCCQFNDFSAKKKKKG